MTCQSESAKVDGRLPPLTDARQTDCRWSPSALCSINPMCAHVEYFKSKSHIVRYKMDACDILYT